MAAAWVGQRKEQVKKFGKRKAPFYVWWTEPSGKLRKKSFGPGPEGRLAADDYRAKIDHELRTGAYGKVERKAAKWSDFIAEYDRLKLANIEPRSRDSALTVIRHVERIAKPRLLEELDGLAIARYVAKRRKERGRKPGSTVSVAALNLELRTMKAMLRWAAKFKFIDAAPEITFIDGKHRIRRYIIDDHFRAIYHAADSARMPVKGASGDWWRGLLTWIAFTGWRISECLALEWRDVALEDGFALTRAEENKGGRDERVWIHPVARAHIAKLLPENAMARDRVFGWDHDVRTLYDAFREIQATAGIRLDCDIRTPHECTDSCHFYTFHDGRRMFATANARLIGKDELRRLMRHKSSATTDLYIGYAKNVLPDAQPLALPGVYAEKPPETSPDFPRTDLLRESPTIPALF